MKKTYFIKLSLILCLLLPQGMPVQAEPLSSASPDFYSNNEVVGFIGDSITYASYTPLSYMDILNLFYLSLFPDRQIEFRNISAGGYKISDILNIYDQDPAFDGLDKAVIMLGTNEAILGISTEDYITNMDALIGRLKEDGLEGSDILLLSPPVCDENCSLNFTKNGSRKWAFESRVLEYMDQLETKSAQWGVRYLDLHTPMAALTETMQQEDPGNTLTTDCIHPNAAGQVLIACSILQAQGADPEVLSQLHVPEDGEPQTQGNPISDFYRGEKGLCLTLAPEVLPLANRSEFTAFRELMNRYTSSGALLQQRFSIQGLSEEDSYCLRAGDEELGNFTGKELAEGIDMGALETNPRQQAMQQAASLCRQRHREVVEARDMWIEVMMQRASFTPEQIQAAYETWRAKDDALNSEIYAITGKLADDVLRITVTAQGYLPEELEQDAQEAKEAARKAQEEQAAREAQEAARKAAEAQAAKEAEEAARKAAQEQAAKEAEEAARKAAEAAAREQAAMESRKRLLLWGSLAGSALLLCLGILGIFLRKKKRR